VKIAAVKIRDVEVPDLKIPDIKIPDIKIPRATHLMHLEENRYALYRETASFLQAEED
jgi:hypothetical protein